VRGWPVSLVGLHHAPAIRLERAVRDLFGLEPQGLPDQRPWLDHGRWETHHPLARSSGIPLGQEPYAFLANEGDNLHQIPVGPVHAGIIEPGHFRFTAAGETVVRLEARLGYTHKGIEGLMAGSDLQRAARLAGCTSGDSTVAYQLAFARAVEAALEFEPPGRATWLRALLAELERLANHLGDIGAICNDAAFAMMLAQCHVLRERVLRANALAFGHRLLRDCIVPGGVATDLSARGTTALAGLVAEIRQSFPALVELYDNTASLQDRTVGTGILRPDLARRFAAGGYVGRASGRNFDARLVPGYAPYDQLEFEVPVFEEGDVNARVWVRIREVEQSLALVAQLLDRTAAGRAHRSADPGRRGVGPGRGLSRRRADLAAPGPGRPGPALPSARSVLVPVAAAGGRHRGQYRRRLPAVQQIVQLLLLRTRPVMRKLLLQNLLRSPLTEPPPDRDDARLEQLAAALQQSARRRLGRSLAIRQVDAGSCNGCELEIQALNNAYYNLERYGLRFVASPRHADVLLVTGPPTRNMREALERPNATPDPKWVVAVGDCARDGGCFAGSYAVVRGCGRGARRSACPGLSASPGAAGGFAEPARGDGPGCLIFAKLKFAGNWRGQEPTAQLFHTRCHQVWHHGPLSLAGRAPRCTLRHAEGTQLLRGRIRAGP
jgi:Ni,Fe-hydrogenase III large subunit/Ni,Fe-hydrogenase III small subunit